MTDEEKKAGEEAGNKLKANREAEEKLKAEKADLDKEIEQNKREANAKLTAEKEARREIFNAGKLASDKEAAEKIKAEKLASAKEAGEQLKAEKLASEKKTDAEKKPKARPLKTGSTDYDEIRKNVDEYKEDKRRTGKQKETTKPISTSKGLITGYVLLLFTDILLPAVMSVINNRFTDEDEHVTPAELRLSAKQMKDIEPIADKAAKEIALNVNPIILFFIIMTISYTGNLIALRSV